MSDLKFAAVAGSWNGNDYPSVSMTSMTVGLGTPIAFLFMTHMNVDFDGAPNAYGPPEKSPQDSLEDAGRNGANGYTGLMAVHPKAVMPGDPRKRLINDVYNLKLDERYPDSKGKCPVVQQTGPYAGFFVSTTAKRNPSGNASIYEQSHYLDSSAVAYSALSYNLQSQGVADGNFGIALRHDAFRTASFSFLGGEGHGKGTPGAGAVGECSYKVFLDIGGSPKTSGQRYPNNNFLTNFIVFPGSKTSQLQRISLADNAEDFAVFLALQAEADKAARGRSGLPAFRKYVADGRKTKPPGYGNIVTALQRWGYLPGLSELVNASKAWVSNLAAGVGKPIP